MRRLLERELGYATVRQEGSHRRMISEGRPDIIFAFHDSVSIPPHRVKGILVKDVGLSLAEAEKVVRNA
ncbi:type II toxin-antitoxin system HicA family toxin [Plantactinospora alkalitolerans]